MYPEADRPGIYSKTLHYVEQSVAHWLMMHDVVVFMIPSHRAGDALTAGNIHVDEYVKRLDGLVLQGGSDVAPETYGETPLRPEWAGDRVRDLYELVAAVPGSEVLVDVRHIPYARELWLPLVYLLTR